MSKYLEYTTGGVNVREKGPGETDPILATITPDDMLAMVRPTSWEKTEAATPKPGGLDIEAELEKFYAGYAAVLGYSGPYIGPKFAVAFTDYLRDLESRRKPAEPSGWPEATEADAKSIYDRALQLFKASRDGEFTIWSQIRRAIQEWLDSKPRPKPVVNSNGTPVADVSPWGSRWPAAGTPESVELSEEQIRDLLSAWKFADGDEVEAFNATFGKLGLGLHRLDPKPSAVDGNLRRVELIMDRLDYAAFRIEMERRKTGLASILPDGEGNLEGRIVAECIRGLHDFLDYDPAATPDPLSGDPKPSAEPDPGDTATPTEADSQEVWQRDILAKADRLDMLRSEIDVQLLILRRDFKSLGDKVTAKLDAIAERLDGPKVEAVDESVLSDVLLSNLFYRLQEKGDFDATRKGVAALLSSFGLMVIRKPLTKGDPS